MKKLILFAFCALMSVCAFAQSKMSWEVQVGFHVGVRG